MESNNEKIYHVDHVKLMIIAFVANLGSLLFGFDFGATSWLLMDISRYGSSGLAEYSFCTTIINSDFLMGCIAAGSTLGAAVTYLFLLFLGNESSKRNEITISACLFLIGALLESLSLEAPWDNWNGFLILIVGRIIYGAGIATSFHSVPQYISEIGPPEFRGIVGSTTEAMVVTGVSLGYFIGYFYENDGWKDVFRFGYIVAIFLCTLSLYLPQSPFWMAKMGISRAEILVSLQFIFLDADEAMVMAVERQVSTELANRWKWEAQLRRFGSSLGDSNPSGGLFSSSPSMSSMSLLITHDDGALGNAETSPLLASKSSDSESIDSSSVTSNIPHSSNEIKDSHIHETKKLDSFTFVDLLPMELQFLFFHRTLRRCLILAVVLVFLQMCTGQAAILFFAGDIFNEICGTSSQECLLGLGFSKILSAYSMVVFADSLARRTFLLVGTFILFLGLFLLCIGLRFSSIVPSLIGIYIGAFGYEIGLGSLLWILLSELFPRIVRSAANSISLSILLIVSLLVTFFLPFLARTLGLFGLFSLFAVASALAWIVIYLIVPETRGFDLETAYKQVDESWNQVFNYWRSDSLDNNVDLHSLDGSEDNDRTRMGECINRSEDSLESSDELNNRTILSV